MFQKVFGWRDLTSLYDECSGGKGRVEGHSPEKTDTCKGHRGKCAVIEIPPGVQKKGDWPGKRERKTLGREDLRR